jgi:hypothetical protein
VIAMTSKNMSADPRIRGIVQKHMEALSREIAKELTQPLLEHWGLTYEDLATPVAEPTPGVTSEPVSPMALIYDGATRRWVCPRCRRYSDLRRRSVTTHLRFCDAVPATEVVASKKPRRKSRQPGRQTKIKKKS